MPLTPSDVRTSAGSFISLSPTLPTAYTEAAYLAITDFVRVREVTDLGEYGRTYTDVTHEPLDERGVIHRKGSFDDGSIDVQMGRSASDAGQQLLQEAVLSDNSYTIMITLQDGTRQFYTGQVHSNRTGVGSLNSITTRTATIMFDSGSGIEVLPAAA